MKATDWTQYYASRPTVNSFTRKYVQNILIHKIQWACSAHPSITECGGANSCFFRGIYADIQPSKYTVIDNNDYGLGLFIKQYANLPNIYGIKADMADSKQLADVEPADLVFSAGLIEHFDAETTKMVISAHFQLVKPEGIVIMTFPTPTLKYRMTRRAMEALHLWKFFDERPLTKNEVLNAIQASGTVIDCVLMDKMPLTQYMVIAKKE